MHISELLLFSILFYRTETRGAQREEVLAVASTQYQVLASDSPPRQKEPSNSPGR